MSLEFPSFTPSTRAIDAGNFPVKSFRAQNGSELRILYGDKRTGMKLSLQYNGLEDAKAELFYDHYHQQKGTFTPFSFYLDTNVKDGWEGNADTLGSVAWGNLWRYDSAPVITNVYPGVSNVSVSLVGVLT